MPEVTINKHPLIFLEITNISRDDDDVDEEFHLVIIFITKETNFYLQF